MSFILTQSCLLLKDTDMWCELSGCMCPILKMGLDCGHAFIQCVQPRLSLSLLLVVCVFFLMQWFSNRRQVAPWGKIFICQHFSYYHCKRMCENHSGWWFFQYVGENVGVDWVKREDWYMGRWKLLQLIATVFGHITMWVSLAIGTLFTLVIVYLKNVRLSRTRKCHGVVFVTRYSSVFVNGQLNCPSLVCERKLIHNMFVKQNQRN